MIDDTRAQQQDAETSASPGTDTGARVGFCQECGCGLSADTLRRVGAGVFCGTCAAFRQAGTGWQNVHANGFNGQMGPIPAGPRSGGPNPVLAGLLGFIPGVGAMYNAQFAKGAMHLIVFVILVAISDNVNWVFWWLVWGWIFYQAFEAYHTARARRDSLPLPNPFGWNDLGERMGFGRSAQSAPESFGSRSSQAGTPGANWAGYVPPTPPPASYPPYSPFAEHTSENPYAAPYAAPGPRPVPPNPPPTSTPYVPTFTGATPLQPVPVPTPITGARRFPVGALWLIILGMIFLLGNLLPELRLSGRWFAPILLAALAFWSAFRRFEVWQSGRRAAWCSSTLSGAMTGPAVLLTVSALLALQTAHILPLHRSWPFLLVVWGSMLLIQRSAAPPAVLPEEYPMPEPVAPPVRSTSGTGSLGL